MISKASMEQHFLARENTGTDAIVRHQNLFRLNNFAYNVGDCLFDNM